MMNNTKQLYGGGVKSKELILWGAIGALVFISIYGLLPLNVTYDHWLLNGYVESDVIQHYAGWLAFRQSDWAMPLGKIEELGETVVTYTDSIPIVAIFFKLLSGVLPETFQYFGIYIFLCFILQGISSGLLISLFSKDVIYTDIGVILFCFSPIMIERAFRHTALASHWLIVFMLYFYFKSRIEKRMDWRSIIIPIISIGIHPYFLPIVFGLMFANMIELAFIEKKTLFTSMTFLVISLTMTIILGYLIGALGTSASLGGSGYGYFSMNLNAIINPTSCSGIIWSRFLKVLPQTLGNYDGFNYLGLGVLLSLAVIILLLILRRISIKNTISKNWVLILLSIAFFLFAVSNVVTLNENIWFQYPLPDKILSLAAVFRASSRIFYPVYYLLMLVSLNSIHKIVNGKWKRIVLIGVLFIQLLDISPALSVKHKSFDRNSIEQSYSQNNFTGSELWNDIATKCSKIKMLNNSYDYKLAAFGEKNYLHPDITISSSHYSNSIDLNSVYQLYITELVNNILDENSVYVTSDESLLALILSKNPNVKLYNDSGYYIMAVPDLELNGELLDISNYTNLMVFNLTDDNWTEGISNFDNHQVLLFAHSELLTNIITNSNYIISADKKYVIQNYEDDGIWIRVWVDKDATSCSYSNVLYFE